MLVRVELKLNMTFIAVTFEALNIQLLASSGFFVGCVIFSFNLFIRPMFDFIPETTPLSVPVINRVG